MEEECTEAQTKQEEEMTKGIPKAQEGISAIWHCLPLRVSGLAQGNCVLNSLKQCWPIPVNGPTQLCRNSIAWQDVSNALENEA